MDSKIALKEIGEVLVGLKEAELNSKVQAAIDGGVDPVSILERGLAPGLRTLGEKFQRGEVFIPHLAAAADMARRQMDALRARLPESDAAGGPKVILGTVQDDIHDLGKNLVAALLSVSGFSVLDLGKDVPVERFVDEAKKEAPALIGMSALMTTTMVNQRAVIQGLERAGVRGEVGVMVGGAPTNEAWANDIGADGHADDVVTAVRLASALASGLPRERGEAS